MAFPKPEDLESATIDQKTYKADLEAKIQRIIELAEKIGGKEEQDRQELKDSPGWTGSKA